MPPITQTFPSKATQPPANRGVQPACSVTRSQCFPSFDDHTSLVAEWLGSRPLYQPPMSHMRSWKATPIAKSECFHGARLVTISQFRPSADFHTSRGGLSKESNQPPISHM